MRKFLHILTLISLLLCAKAQECVAQSTLRISGSFHNKSLPQVLDELRDEYHLIFAYDVELLSHIRIRKKIRSLPLREALAELLEDTGLQARIVRDRQVIISRKLQTGSFERAAIGIRSARHLIEGTVLDAETGVPLPYAGIQIVGTAHGTSSRTNGAFSLRVEQNDLLNLEISYVGYEQVRVPVIPGRQSKVEIRLTPLVVALDEVVIEEGQRPVMEAGETVSTLRLDARQLGKISGFGKPDILQAMRMLPGISSTNDLSPGLYLRGGTPDQNLTLFDGITAYRSDHFFGLFSAFNPDATESAVIHKSGFGARYGGRVSGLVEVKGKSPDLSRLRLRGNINLLDGHIAAEIPLIDKKLSLLLAGRKSVSALFQRGQYQNMLAVLLGTDRRDRNRNYIYGVDLVQFQPDPEFTFSDVNLKLAYKPSPTDSLAISYFQARDILSYSIGTDSSKITNGANAKVITHTDELALSNSGLGLTWHKTFSPRYRSRLSISRSRFLNQYYYALKTETEMIAWSSYLQQYNGIRELKANWDHEWQIHPRFELVFGNEVARQDIRHRFDSDYILWEDGNAPGTLYASYLQTLFQPVEGLKIQGGLRHTFFDITRQSYWEPRVSLDVQLKPRLRLSVAGGKYNQFINRVVVNNDLGIGEDFWAMANGSDIPVQTARHLVTGLTYESPDFLLSLEAYSKHTNGILEYVHGIYLTELDETVMGDLTSGGTSKAQGLELLAQKKVGLYSGWISYSLGQVKNRFTRIQGGNYFPALQDQRHEIKVVNLLSLKKWDISATWIYGSGRPYTEAIGSYYSELPDGSTVHFLQVGERNSLRLPPYHRLDLMVAYKWRIGKGRGNIGGSIYNLYDRANIRTRRYRLYAPVSRSANSRLSVANVAHLGITPNIFLSINL